MRPRLPGSIVGRLVLVLLTGLVVSQVIGLVIYATDRQDTVATARVHLVAERVVTVAAVMEAAPPDRRQELARVLGGRRWMTTWLSSEPLVEQRVRDWRARMFAGLLKDHDGEMDTARTAISYGAPEVLFPGHPFLDGMTDWMRRVEPEAGSEALFVSVPLSDGGWVNFMAPFVKLESFWTSGFFLSVLALTFTVLLVAFWAVNRSSSPLRLFALAAERLGRDVNAPALPEEGPDEVRDAAQAFNLMQGRLKSYIQDRTQMLAAISHDLRTPITRLKLRAEFLDDEDMRKRMLNDLDTMESMIAGTLAFARDDAAKEPLGEVDLAALVKEAVQGQVELGRDVTYLGPETLIFEGRALALKRALGNVIDNAVKYGDSARVSLVAEHDAVLVRVDDQGPGIPEDRRDDVFKPFFRLDEARNLDQAGSGLGLAVVRSITRAHGGEIELENRAEGGLSLTITLPARPTSGPAQAEDSW
ncbi:MAG: ATP-binding protein [Magnetovibrionaceae bacterium]